MHGVGSIFCLLLFSFNFVKTICLNVFLKVFSMDTNALLHKQLHFSVYSMGYYIFVYVEPSFSRQ